MWGGLAAALVAAIAEGPVLDQTTGSEGMGAGGQFEGSGMGWGAHREERRFRRVNVPLIDTVLLPRRIEPLSAVDQSAGSSLG